MSDLPRSASVVVIGAGIMGTSIAFHLTRRGIHDVVVLERATAGSGSTGKNAGGIRLQFSTEINVRLSQRSLPEIESFAELTGIDAGFHQVGYLFLITDERDVASFERSLALWDRLGVPARKLGPEEARALVPQLRVDDVRFATFCPKDGYADPSSLVRGYARCAREGGARILEDTAATGIEVRDGRVDAVRVDGARIACETVVNAAGAWAREVGRMAGVEVPVDPYRRMIFVTEPFDGLARDLPMVIDFATGFYFHRESGGILLGMADRNEPPGFREDVDWTFLPTVVERALHRVPILEGAAIRTGWAGLYETTPDAHPVLGAVGEPRGFLCACGFSGHGVMHAPATGALLAELVADGRTSLDISSLALERFRTGRAIPEHNVV